MYFTKVGLIGFTPTCVVNLMIMKIEKLIEHQKSQYSNIHLVTFS